MQKNTELRNMMIVSNAFFELTKISNRSVIRIDKVETIPVVTNCAFSIELALKFLYYANNNTKIMGHNIKELYQKVKEYGLEDYLLQNFTSPEIDRMLREFENAFEEFRYIYEQEKTIHIDLLDVQNFTKFINAYCMNYLKKELNITI